MHYRLRFSFSLALTSLQSLSTFFEPYRKMPTLNVDYWLMKRWFSVEVVWRPHPILRALPHWKSHLPHQGHRGEDTPFASTMDAQSYMHSPRHGHRGQVRTILISIIAASYSSPYVLFVLTKLNNCQISIKSVELQIYAFVVDCCLHFRTAFMTGSRLLCARESRLMEIRFFLKPWAPRESNCRVMCNSEIS